ncbi:MAG TPA: phosphoribosylaminoimidazolecarboxamide formyltransferase [Longimicrobium sp.]|nr:phosphoribosylaminoimidazolecarboxamide formyltransferase [Longimicrobium sp.]
MAEEMSLRYGMNPHQRQAAVAGVEGRLPFEALQGQPGYINLLDALKAWQLVRELAAASGLPAATSFKHTNPIGAGVGIELSGDFRDAFQVERDADLSPLASAYLRARSGDRVAAYGDFIALSEPVDLPTARVIQGLVSDGIVAPGYDPEALEILKGKKNGRYLVLRMDPGYEPPPIEHDELFGVRFRQERNQARIDHDLLANVVTREKTLPEPAALDLLLATIVVKYCQSNAVCVAFEGQAVGVGVGQQSRIECTRIACDKADRWLLRRHPAVPRLRLRPGLRKHEIDTAIDEYLRWNELGEHERQRLLHYFEEPPEPISPAEREEWLRRSSGLSLSSDGFIPFRDNLDRAARSGVAYVVQPGGSLRDDDVIAAANEHGMWMAFSGLRLFYH